MAAAGTSWSEIRTTAVARRERPGCLAVSHLHPLKDESMRNTR